MDVLIQQDGRIQTNIAVEPSRSWFFTEEICGLTSLVPAGRAENMHVIRREFRKVAVEGRITVWVEAR